MLGIAQRLREAQHLSAAIRVLQRVIAFSAMAWLPGGVLAFGASWHDAP